MRITNKYIFFWGDWPSNWYPCHFVVKENGEELNFSSSEQYFMWKKATTFGDEETAKKKYSREDTTQGQRRLLVERLETTTMRFGMIYAMT
jgi:predicted NAD-dependent protein-ADP-ribosyltransferase YbiA (DUF1768 family)